MKAQSLLTVALLSLCALSSVAHAEKKADGEKKSPPSPAKLIEKMDADENGTLSKEEVSKNKKLTARFDKIDTDSNGEIDEAELKAGLVKKPKKKKADAEDAEDDGDED